MYKISLYIIKRMEQKDYKINDESKEKNALNKNNLKKNDSKESEEIEKETKTYKNEDSNSKLEKK